MSLFFTRRGRMTVPGAYSEERTEKTGAWLSNRRIDSRPQYSLNMRGYEAEMFISFARKSKGRILELASGACRMMRPLAEAGFDVYGLEASRSMISAGRQFISDMLPEAKKRIRIVQGDMYHFAFQEKFGLITIPFCTFWYALHRAQEESGVPMIDNAHRCLACVSESLMPGGVFIVDSPNISSCFPDGAGPWWAESLSQYGMSGEIKSSYVIEEGYEDDFRYGSSLLIATKH